MSRRSETETDLCCPDPVGIEGNILVAAKDIETPVTMNCATHGQVTINELVKKINEKLNKNVKAIFVDARSGDIKHSFASIDLIKRKLNWQPEFLFDRGIELVINSFESK